MFLRLVLGTIVSGIAVSSLPARAGLPTYANIQIQARSNFNQTIGTFNLPANAFFSGITAQLNDVGDVAFNLGVLPGNDSDGIWIGRNASGQIDYTSPDGALISSPSMNNAARVVWQLSFAPVEGLYFLDGATGTSGVLTTRPLGASGWGSPVINDAGEVGYRANFLGDHAYVSYLNEFNPPFHAVEAGIDPMSPYSFLFTSSANAQRQIAGKVRLGAAGQTGGSQPDQIRIFNMDGSSTLIAEDADSNPLSSFSSFDNSVFLTDDGWVAFTADLTNGQRGVFISDGVTTTPIATTALRQLDSVEFFAPAANNHHLVAFRGINNDGLRSIWLGDGIRLIEVITEHDLVPIDQDLTARIDQESTSNPVFGGGVVLNECGDLAFNAGVAPPDNDQVEWGSGVFVAYAARDLDGDYDCNGTLDERDLTYFVDCLGGPLAGPNAALSPAYICSGKFDFDSSGHLDLIDYAEFQRQAALVP